jgi:hypothetical protein
LATGGRDPTNSDGTATDTLSFKNYAGKTNGSFSAVSETGSGGDLATAYQSLLSAMQANGETDDATTSQLKDAFSQLQDKSQDGSADATVSGGEMLVQAGGPIQFAGISAYQNGFVDSVISDLTRSFSTTRLREAAFPPKGFADSGESPRG